MIMKKICIVGLGNMGQAIFDILSSKKLFEVFGCSHADDINEKLKSCDVFIIAVKPQNFNEFAESVSVDLSDKLAISIMAGINIAKIQENLGSKRVVRTLPNLALKIGRSMTVWKSSEEAVSDRELIAEILACFGEQMELKSEEAIGDVGSISGCGPAYFAFFTEQLIKAAKKCGLSDEAALKIAKATFVGTAELLDHEGWTPEELRAKITSKGGTTNAAITHLESAGFDKIFLEAIEAANRRTKELNEEA